MGGEQGSAAASDRVEALLRLIHGYQFTQALYTATRLGLPDLIAAGPRSAAELAAETGAHAPSLTRLLRALVTLEVVAAVGPDSFGPTPLSDLLRADVPGSQRAWLLAAGADFYRTWGHLLDVVRTGRTARQLMHGTDA